MYVFACQFLLGHTLLKEVKPLISLSDCLSVSLCVSVCVCVCLSLSLFAVSQLSSAKYASPPVQYQSILACCHSFSYRQKSARKAYFVSEQRYYVSVRSHGVDTCTHE